MQERRRISSTLIFLIVSAIVVVGLFLISSYSYLLFHSIIEIFAVLIAFAVFVIGWNSVSETKFFNFIGIAYIFVAAIDILHTLSYSGTGIFPGYDANLPTQLWILARYIESCSILVAPYIMNKSVKKNYYLLAFFLVSAVSLVTIFTGVFPDCFIVGEGLTTFKIVSEYIIAGILIIAGISYHLGRERFDEYVLNLLFGSIILTIAAEMAFTLYSDVYGIANMIGHYLRFASYFLIYKAIVESSLVRPFEVMFRDLKRSEGSLIVANDNLELTTKMVRHDIRHELSVITLSIELYQQSKNQDMLTQALESIARCNELIETSKLVSLEQEHESNLYPVNIRQTLVRAIGGSNLKISIDGDGTALAGAALLSVFRNIIKNAEIHSETGELEISILTKDNLCEIRISDFGIGISEENKKRIFEEGFRDGSKAGSGLGLYIARKLIESYNGEIYAETNHPSGTIFVVKLPCTQPAPVS